MTTAVPAPEEYAEFVKLVASLTSLHLQDYKQGQMERRIREMAHRQHAPSLSAFGIMLQRDPQLLRQFEQHVTINVSEFYRNPDAFTYLQQQVLPAVLQPGRPLRIWSAGCSYGAEPYTIAMLLHRLDPEGRHHIRATDIDRQMLDRARTGIYSEEEVRALPAWLRDRYLVQHGATVSILPALSRSVRFDRHDLLHDPITQQFDLIACRNVVIYFTEQAKARIFAQFAGALRTGGWLFIGGTETINRPAAIGLTYRAPCFYQKTAV